MGDLGLRIKVDKVRQTNNYTLVTWDGTNQIWLRPYIYIKPDDILEFIPNLESYKEIYKVFVDKGTGVTKRVKIYPPYRRSEIIEVPPHRFKVSFRERLYPSDWKAIKNLEQFHYRGKGLNRLVGRRSLLIAECDGFGIIGFGVLSATLPVASPRFKLFNIDFSKQMKTGLINQIIRIPRVVVHPEFRGMGVGVLIAKHLIQYAEEYWDNNHYTPILIEVIAAMTEYHKFFEKAGFIKLGYTSGYTEGIIPQYGVGSFKERPNHRFYNFMRNQKAKPYLVFPLESWVEQKIKEIYNANLQVKEKQNIENKKFKLKSPIKLEKVSVTYRVSNRITSRTLAVKDIFGVDSTHLTFPILKDLTLTVEPGDVVLITGASGSGKSTLLKLFSNNISQLKHSMVITGRIQGLNSKNIAILPTYFDNSIPLIEQVMKGKDIREAIELLNSVGLAEAHLYLKPPSQISDGQRYRFAVAKLCDSKKPLWIADEFAATLNPEIAAVVAKGLRKIAWKFGSTLILAAPHIDHFVDSLFPTKLIMLKWGGQAVIYSIKLKISESEGGLKISIVNNGNLPLKEVQIKALNITSSTSILQKDVLLPQERIITCVEEQSFTNYTAIAVQSADKVGDIFYINL